MTGARQDTSAQLANDKQAAWWNRFLRSLIPLGSGDLARLLFINRHSIVFIHQRARFILKRTGLVANWFAVLTLFWIPVEALIFPQAVWQSMALGRIGAGLAFMALGSYFHRAVALGQVYPALAMLFLIPSAVSLFAHTAISDAPLGGIDAIVTGSYAFVPFVLVAGLSIFPLTIVEIAVLGLLLLAVATIHVIAQHAFMMHGLNVEGLLMLGVVAAVAGLSALSQLQLMHKLFTQSAIDLLTGVINRKSGTELMALQFAMARRYRYPLALAFIDLDDFKKINDTAGHDAGDRILAQAAQSWRATLRDSDSIMRWGGEEFIVLLPHMDCMQAELLMLSRRPVLQRPDGKPLTYSIGIAEWLADNVSTADKLVALADQRMYQAKTTGKDRVVGRTPGQ